MKAVEFRILVLAILALIALILTIALISKVSKPTIEKSEEISEESSEELGGISEDYIISYCKVAGKLGETTKNYCCNKLKSIGSTEACKVACSLNCPIWQGCTCP